MNPLTRWLRLATALVAVIAVALSAAATAGAAAPERTADTTTYTSASFLETTLGLPDKPKHVIESVTYDRFQWLLQQPGKFAFLIGDPASDPTFAARARDVESVADEAGVKQVYWFNPNLSGNAVLGDITQPNLDIRDASGITALHANRRGVFARAWENLVGQYLGNGLKATPAGVNTGSATVTTAPDPTVVNDYGEDGYSTKIGDVDGGALYDYRSGTPEDVTDSFFLLYDKDNNVTVSSALHWSKIVAWVNLSEQASAESARQDVAAAISTCGAANVTAISEFEWWKSANNAKHFASTQNDYEGKNVPNLTDADGAAANGGWRVHQVTYPELVHLLKTEDTKEVVLLLGGTWCPNTRPVLPAINKYAQRNDVTVFNFDTILDGGVVGGGNSPSNPLQSRNPRANGGFDNANPSFIYGELVARYLNNLKTQYKAGAANRITYYPGGDITQPEKSQPRLQVPYLVGYQGQAGDEPYGGAVRQWIHDTGVNDPGTGTRNYTEYMSVWHFTNPQPGQLGVQTANAIRNTQAWTTLNNQLATFTWQTDPATVRANTGIDTDAAQFLTPTDTATVTYTAANPAATPPREASVSVASSTAAGAIDVNPTVLASALTALGSTAPANNVAARNALIEAESAPTRDETRISHLRTVVGAWGVSQQRKNTVNSIWGDVGSPSSVIGGAAAVRAAEVFFAGLPDRPSTDPDPDPDPGTGGDTNPNPGGGGTQPPAAAPPAPATPAAPPVNPIRSTTVRKIAVSRLAGSVAKAPTSKRAGRYTVKVTVPRGAAKATGKVTLTLKKGSRTRTITGTLKNGAVTISVPKLAKGTWKVTIAWPGDATYRSGSATGTIKVRK